MGINYQGTASIKTWKRTDCTASTVAKSKTRNTQFVTRQTGQNVIAKTSISQRSLRSTTKHFTKLLQIDVCHMSNGSHLYTGYPFQQFHKVLQCSLCL